MYNLPRQNQEEIENMNWCITSNKIESIILKLKANQSAGPDVFTGEFYQTFREELTVLLLRVFQKLAERGMLLNLKASITLITKQDKDITTLKLNSIFSR